MNTSTCPSCNREISEGDRFCGSCGAATPAIPVSAAALPPPAVAVAPVEPASLLPAAAAARFRPTDEPYRTPRLPAGFWNRLVAWLIDFAILWGAGSLLCLALFPDADAVGLGGLFAVTGLSIVYRPLMWRFRNGQTIGQQAMKICVLKDDGTPIGLGRGVWRVLATWITGQIPIAGSFNVLSMLWNHERRCWFDRWSDTRVDAREDPRLLGFVKRT